MGVAVPDPVDARLLALVADVGRVAVHDLARRAGMDVREVAARLAALASTGLPLVVGVECDANGLRHALASPAVHGVGQGAYGAPSGPYQVNQPSGPYGHASPMSGPLPAQPYPQQPHRPGYAAAPAYSAPQQPGPYGGAHAGSHGHGAQHSGPHGAHAVGSGPYPVGAAHGSTTHGSTVGGSSVSGSTAYGSTMGGSTAHGSTAYGSTAGSYTTPGSAQHGGWVAPDPIGTWGPPGSASWARGDAPGTRPDQPSATITMPAPPGTAIAGRRTGTVGERLLTEGIDGEHLAIQLVEVVDPADFLFTAAGYSLQAGERSVVVHTELTNRGGAPFSSVPDLHLVLVDADGRSVAKAPVSLSSRPPHRIGVQPGETAGGHTVFVLPDATDVAAVRWSPRPGDDPRSLTWTVE